MQNTWMRSNPSAEVKVELKDHGSVEARGVFAIACMALLVALALVLVFIYLTGSV